jgi:hypothetical protein
VAGAPLGRDVCADPVDHVNSSVAKALGANDGFRFAKAVAQKSRALSLLLPYRYPDVRRAETVAGVTEIDDVTRGGGAEPMRRELNSPERDLGQERLHGLELNSGSAMPASRAGPCIRFKGHERSINPEVHFRVKRLLQISLCSGHVCESLRRRAEPRTAGL